MVVRVRVDGVMRELGTVPRHMQPAVTSRLKIMGKLDIADRRAPQDGRVTATFGSGQLDMRIAVIPTTHGEQVVLRLLGGHGQRPTMEQLEMDPTAEQAFLNAVDQPYGTVIVCGPTGSGKTTTLYGAVDHLNSGERVVMTIEDPVEYRLDGVNQIEVDPKGGLTFASGLRTILRSDPDVLLVGEVRDAGDGVDRDPGGDDRSPRAHVAARTHRSERGRPPARHGRRHVAARELAERRRRTAPRAASLRPLPRAVRGERSRARLGRRPRGIRSIVLYRAVGCAKCQGTGYCGSRRAPRGDAGARRRARSSSSAPPRRSSPPP